MNFIYKWSIATHYKFTMKITSSSSHTELLACLCKWPIIFPPQVLLAMFCAQVVLFFPFRHLNPCCPSGSISCSKKFKESFWTSSWSSVVCSAFLWIAWHLSYNSPVSAAWASWVLTQVDLLGLQADGCWSFVCESSSDFPARSTVSWSNRH